jgi:hypothetical protein
MGVVMDILVWVTDGIRLNPNAFRRDDDETWTVLAETKIYSGEASIPNTLLLPDGMQVRVGMFWVNDIDLFDLLEGTSPNISSDRYRSPLEAGAL